MTDIAHNYAEWCKQRGVFAHDKEDPTYVNPFEWGYCCGETIDRKETDSEKETDHE